MLRAMRLLPVFLGSAWLIASCVPRSPTVANNGTPPGAPGATVGPMPLPPDAPVAIHQVSEIEPAPVAVASEPIPGFMRGINLGNALDAPQEGAWGVTLDEKHFEMAKAAGLDHIRLPVRFNSHAKDEAPYTIEEKFFERVDWAIDQAAKRGLSIFDYFKIVEAYIKSSKRRVYLGEFGVTDNADPKSREVWLRIVRQEAEKRKIGWAIWDDGGKFRAMNVTLGTWVAPIHAGLFE
jgi:aryl-phospho-beta-D-glucosidase BglC (GH1 family)